MTAETRYPRLAIFPASIAHLDDIVQMERESFLTPWDRSTFEHEITALSWSRTLIAAMDDVPVGYLSFWTVADEYQILKVAVHPQYRRRHIGAGMITHLISLARKERIAAITLELRESNEAAQSLYTACGFQTDGLRKGYYTDTGENAILMSCNLLSESIFS